MNISCVISLTCLDAILFNVIYSKFILPFLYFLFSIQAILFLHINNKHIKCKNYAITQSFIFTFFTLSLMFNLEIFTIIILSCIFCNNIIYSFFKIITDIFYINCILYNILIISFLISVVILDILLITFFDSYIITFIYILLYTSIILSTLCTITPIFRKKIRYLNSCDAYYYILYSLTRGILKLFVSGFFFQLYLTLNFDSICLFIFILTVTCIAFFVKFL